MAEKSIVALYTGNGKGKTTAAIGQIIRACGAGWKVGLVRLLKNETSAELNILTELPQVEILTASPQLEGFYSDLSDVQRQEIDAQCQAALEYAQGWLQNQQVDLLVIDEAIVAASLNIITINALLDFFHLARAAGTDLVLTGRYAPAELIAAADLVTDMQEVKHPYQQGYPARRGIDF